MESVGIHADERFNFRSAELLYAALLHSLKVNAIGERFQVCEPTSREIAAWSRHPGGRWCAKPPHS